MKTAGSTETPKLSGLIDVSFIGAGGFADVYRARQAHLGRWVALKVSRVAVHDPAVSSQFRAECQAVSRLDEHLNVIRVYDAGLLPDGRPYLVTELCESTLQELVVRRGGALREPEAAAHGYRIAVALLAAHSAQVIHGDVTPHNVLIRTSGTPVLADFGLAVLRDYRGNTASGFSPAYAAPETLGHDGRIDERIDVYGLGATLYAMLTGRAPFAKRWGESDAERNQRVLDEPVSWPPGVSVTDRFSGLVSAMLAKNPAERPELAVVADELAELKDDREPLLYPESMEQTVNVDSERTNNITSAAREVPHSPAPADDPAGAAPQMQVSRPRRSTPRASRRSLLLAVASAVLIFAVGVAIPTALGARTAGDGTPTIRTVDFPGISLAPPDPVGSLATRLSWSGSPGLTYTLVVARQGAEPRDEPAGDAMTLVVATEPTAAYCFQVRGTDGQRVFQSNVQPLRGATC